MSLKRKLAEVAGMTGCAAIAENLFQNSPRVIFFHGITDKPIKDRMPQACQSKFDEFQIVIEYLLSHNYNFISVDEFYDGIINEKKFTQKDIILTFDDGYRNNYTVAAPYLKAKDIPFMVFVCARYVSEGERIPPYYVSASIFNNSLNKIDLPSLNIKYDLSTDKLRWDAYYDLFNIITTRENTLVNEIVAELKENLGKDELERLKIVHSTEDIMNWDEVRDIQNYGCTIASHCMDHAVLHKNQPVSEIKYQLEKSRALIIDNIGKCDYFSYPNGNRISVCDEAVSLAGKEYKLAFGVDGKPVKDINNRWFVSRISTVEDLNVFKSQFSILSLFNGK